MTEKQKSDGIKPAEQVIELLKFKLSHDEVSKTVKIHIHKIHFTWDKGMQQIPNKTLATRTHLPQALTYFEHHFRGTVDEPFLDKHIAVQLFVSATRFDDMSYESSCYPSTVKNELRYEVVMGTNELTINTYYPELVRDALFHGLGRMAYQIAFKLDIDRGLIKKKQEGDIITAYVSLKP